MNKKNLLPQLKNIGFIRENAADIVFNMFSDTLGICYVEDMGETIQYISQKILDEQNISIEEVSKFAMENLYAMENTQNKHLMDNGDGTKSISYETYDGYDAARFLTLMGENLNYFVETLGDPFVVAIPCRDFLLAAPLLHKERLSSYSRQLFEEKPHPLIPDIIVFSTNEETFQS